MRKMKAKIFGIAIAICMATTVLATFATPVAAADAQSAWSYCYDHTPGTITANYVDAAGQEGWSLYWTTLTDTKPIYRGNPPDSNTWMYFGAPNNLMAGAWVLDNLYPDPAGWLYNSELTIFHENATGYGAYSWTASTGPASPYFMPNVRLQVMPASTPVDASPNIDLTLPAFPQFDDLGNPLPAIDAQLQGYMIYRYSTPIGNPSCTWNDNPAMGPVNAPGSWVLVAGTEAAPIPVGPWSDLGIMTGSGNTHYYSIVPVIRGVANNVGFKYGGLGEGVDDPSIAPGTPPQTHTLGDAPDPHDGNVVTDFVTISAIGDDSMHSGVGEPNNINAAEFTVDGMGPWPMNPTDGTFDSPTEGVDSVFWFPPGFTEGPHTYSVHSSDNVDGWNNTMPWPSGTFTITDTTAPLGDYTAATPVDGASRAIGNPAQIWCWYEDFTAYSSAVLYWWNATEGFRANSLPMNNNTFMWNSYYNVFEESFTVYGAAGDTITYEIELQDSAVGGPNILVLAQRTLIPFDAADQPQDPYPIYGYTYQYDGTSGAGYAPLLITGCTVEVTWANTSSGGWSTISYTDVAATGQYSVDILNYSEGGYVFCNVTANPNTFSALQLSGSLGYNWTIVEAIAVPGGRMQNVTCGVPYNITWLQPLAASTWAPSASIPAEYIITDRNGILAPGYYNFGGPAVDRGFVNITAGPVLPAVNGYQAPLDKVFEGIADPDPGHFLDLVNLQIYFPGGLWWLNVSEGGQLPLTDTFFLTDWGAWWLDPLSTIPGWLKDWDNITIFIQVGGFDWELEFGWNLVSCPQDATYRAAGSVNLFFDSQDALNWTNLYLINILGLAGDPALSIADRTGGNPSTYATYDLDTGEAAAFPLDTLHGYWVYTSLAGPNIIHFDSINATTIIGTTNTQVQLFAGWNLQGFQHNYSVAGWTVIPTASMFTDGTIDPGLNVPAFWKIVATEWQEPTDWYISYVVTNIFPGMADKNWAWDMFTANPGVGFWLWVPADVLITYDCTF
jgi:hypothetical protein